MATYDFASVAGSLGWTPVNDLAPFTADGEGIHTQATGGDPYMVGPRMALEAGRAPHLEVRLRLDKGADAQLFWETPSAGFNEAASQHFAVIPDGQWRTYRITLKGNPGWQGKITRLRLDPTSQGGGAISLASIRALGPLPPDVTAQVFSPVQPVAPADRSFTVQAILVNRGDLPAEGVTAALDAGASSALAVAGDPAVRALGTLAPSVPVTVTWQAMAPAGVYPLGLTVNGRMLKEAMAVVETDARSQMAAVESGSVRLAFEREPFGYGAAALEMRDSAGWRPVGRMRALGWIAYRDASGGDRQALFYAPQAEPALDGLAFTAEHRDADGALWTLRARFAGAGGAPWIAAEYTLSADRPVRLLAFAGPELYAGEGAPGFARDSALFPGLEYLLGDERSSGTDFASDGVAARYVPHPNKITIPLMAVTGSDVTCGLMWDPLQRWDGEHDRPAALFASPNTWEGQENHLMRLFAPGMTAGLAENAGQLDAPYDLAPGASLTLAARIFAASADGPLAPLDLWLAAQPLPDRPPRPRPDAETARLALENYRSVTWVPDAQGWRYAIHDPWGPGSNTAVQLHLWLSGDVAARDQALAGQGKPPVGGKPNQWFYRPAWLLNRGATAAELRASFEDALAMAARQSTDGSWRYTPPADAKVQFGAAGDTSSGYTATYAFPVLYAARITGHPALVESGLKALAFLDTLPLRPEGAQTWELSLHAPDVLASAWVSQAYLEGYRLTGEATYLDAAERWAMTGLPFVYLWNAPDRPIMRYGTIPVFGATNYTFPWFGRPVMWNGLDYAYGLHGLADELDRAGRAPRVDWRGVAEGITVVTAQMVPESGDYLGMYPDAWDVVTGGEAYTWWLAPTYLLHSMLLAQDEPGAQVQTRIGDLNGKPLRVSAAAVVDAVEATDGRARVAVRGRPGEPVSVIFSPLDGSPARVQANGADVTTWSYAGGILVVQAAADAIGAAEIVIE